MTLPSSKKKFLHFIPILLFLVSIGMTLFLIFTTAGKITDSDAAAELIFSRMLAQDGKISLLNENWYYSTELRFFHSQIIYTLLFHLFDNFLFVRIAGSMILCALYVLSFLYLCRGLNLSNQSFFLGAAFLLFPTSIPYARIILMHHYYTPYLIIMFLAIGTIGRILKSFNNKKKNFYFYWIFFSFLSLLMGLTSLRFFVIFIIPLALSFFVYLFLRPDIEKISFRFPEQKQIFLLFAASIVFSFIGYWLNQAYFSKHYSVGGIGTLNVISPSLEHFNKLLVFVFEIFGYRPGFPVFSLFGLSSILSIVSFFIYIGFSLRGFFLLQSKKLFLPKFLSLFFPILFAVNFAACFLSTFGGSHPLYQIPPLVFAFPMALSIYAIEPHFKRLQSLFLAFLLAVGLMNSISTLKYFSNYQSYGDKVAYSGLANQNPNTVEELQGVKNYLLKNDLTIGYASYWNSNVLTEISNGEIKVVPLSFDSLLPYRWLTSKTLIEKAPLQEKVFLLLTINESNSFAHYDTLHPNFNLEYEDDDYLLYSLNGSYFQNP